MRWIYDAVTLGNPQQSQIEFCLRTLNTLRSLIQREPGIALSKSSVSRLLGHLGLSPHRGTTWGKIGETPVVSNSGGRFSFNLISAVSPRGDMRFSFIAERMNSARFIGFLKKLRTDAGKPILVVVDNARYHHSKETQRFIAAQDGEIRLAFLPTYTPESNPDEQVWNHTKARLGRRPILSKDDMQHHLMSILRSIRKTTSLIKSFFRTPGTKYILEALA